MNFLEAVIAKQRHRERRGGEAETMAVALGAGTGPAGRQ